MLEAAPEQRRTQEEDDDDADALLFDGGEAAEKQHVAEEANGDGDLRDEQSLRQRGFRWHVFAHEQEAGADQHRDADHCHEHPRALLLLGGDFRRVTGRAEIFLGHLELREPDEHREATGEKAEAPIPAFAQTARDEWPNRRTQVDAHVEDGEPGITSCARLAFVQRADDTRDVRLQQANAEHDHRESDVEDCR